MKRIVVISDTHCGHHFGLTPPDWWYGAEATSTEIQKIADFQRALWGFYREAIDALKPIYALICNGDLIDGKGERSGGVEQLTTDRIEQCRMAARIIDEAEAKKVRILYGTRYHVGKEEDFESIVTDMIHNSDVSIEGHGFYTPEGTSTNFDIKHKVGSSVLPHTRHTAVARSRLLNVMWNERQRQPKAHILVRSHVHYYDFCGSAGWVAMTTPALSYNTAFGIRECEGLVDVGFLCFDVGNEEGNYTWAPVLANFPQLAVKSSIL